MRAPPTWEPLLALSAPSRLTAAGGRKWGHSDLRTHGILGEAWCPGEVAATPGGSPEVGDGGALLGGSVGGPVGAGEEEKGGTSDRLPHSDTGSLGAGPALPEARDCTSPASASSVILNGLPGSLCTSPRPWGPGRATCRL